MIPKTQHLSEGGVGIPTQARSFAGSQFVYHNVSGCAKWRFRCLAEVLKMTIPQKRFSTCRKLKNQPIFGAQVKGASSIATAAQSCWAHGASVAAWIRFLLGPFSDQSHEACGGECGRIFDLLSKRRGSSREAAQRTSSDRAQAAKATNRRSLSSQRSDEF
jgi:hypothetical protein